MRTLTVILVAAVVLFPMAAYAIDVSGDQWGTWTRDNSPYNVVGEVRVPPESTLVIEPGIVVNFQGHYKFIVDSLATLLAVGTQADSILFTCDTLGNPDRWRGVRFLSADSTSEMSFCRLEYGKPTGGPPYDYGGAIYCQNSRPTISDNTIRCNFARNGGGIYCGDHSTADIYDNMIVSNRASNNGGGICCSYSDPMIVRNVISGNRTENGGGIYCEQYASPTISHNTIANNSADHKGGAIACYSSAPEIINNTISRNSAAFQGGGVITIQYPPSPTIVSSILWDDTPGEIWGDVPTRYSDVQGGWTGPGNIDADPIFVDPEGADFHLEWGSPCIDTGDPNSPPDPDGTRADMGGLYFHQGILFSPTKYDFCLLIETATDKLLTLQNPPQHSDTTSFDLSSNVDWISFFPDTGYIPPDSSYDVSVAFDGTSLPLGRNEGTIFLHAVTSYHQYTYEILVSVHMFSTEYTYISLTPDSLPIVIPPEGGSFSFWAHTYNATDFTYRFDVWIDATLPGGPRYGPIYKKRNLVFKPQQSTGYHLTQYVPEYAPPGGYSYNMKMGVLPDQVEFVDSFGFMKIDAGSVAGHPRIESWELVGWGEEVVISPAKGHMVLIPTTYSLSQNHPNPFNVSTIIEYELPKPCCVRLEVFNLQGQRVDVLMDGWERPGAKAVRWEGDVASGVYFYRLTAGDFMDTKRMLLVK